MGYALPLFLGFVTASLGITPPGMINMTAAKVSMNEGRTRAMIFSLGATLVVLVQTLIAILFAQFIDKNPDIVVHLREAGLAIFVVLTIYFFTRARKPKASTEETKLHSKKSRFFLGMLLSALNLFPVPFYVFVSVTLSSYNYFSFERDFVYTFVIGSGLGSLFAFYCYIAFFKKMESKTAYILNNMNYIIGAITGLVSILTLLNILQYYYNA
jgi:threonine/homoserine/homoserine lactone efflux protein